MWGEQPGARLTGCRDTEVHCHRACQPPRGQQPWGQTAGAKDSLGVSPVRLV